MSEEVLVQVTKLSEGVNVTTQGPIDEVAIGIASAIYRICQESDRPIDEMLHILRMLCVSISGGNKND